MFQRKGADTLLSPALWYIAVVTQPFQFKWVGKLVPRVAKVLYDLLIAGVTSIVDDFLVIFNKKFQLKRVLRRPCIIKFNSTTIVQNKKHFSFVQADRKL